MHHPSRRFARTLIAAAIALVPLAAPAAADPEPTAPQAPPALVTDHCPHKTGTPPAVDTSETVAPGSSTPTSLPVPATPLGGDGLGGCGVLTMPGAPAAPQGLTSAGWLIADLDSGQVLAAKDPHGRYRPASTIKVLLACVAIENLDPNLVVEGTDNDAAMEGDSAGMGPGGKYTVRELLTGLLLVSGNDTANALARTLGGIDATLAKMNDLAAKLGAKDTRAASPSGLDAAGMSTSPYDLALIFRHAMSLPLFGELDHLLEAPFPGYPARTDVPGDKPHPGYVMAAQNKLLQLYPGGKTGFTDDALKTYVGAAERDGKRIVITQMFGVGVEGNTYWDQAARMLDYGFANNRETGLGKLLDPDPEVKASHTQLGQPAPERSGSDDRSSILPWGLLGGAVVLAAGGAAIWAASRRRGRH